MLQNLNEKYVIQFNKDYGERDRNMLNYYYQPLIGVGAFTLYNFLLQENNFMISNKKGFLLNRIIDFININIQELNDLIEKLVYYGLLDFYYQNNKNNPDYHVFVIRKPLNIIEFSNSGFFDKFEKKINGKDLEQLYFYLRPNNFLQNSQSESNLKIVEFKTSLTNFLNDLKILKQSNYILKIKDINSVQYLIDKYKISLNIVRLILEFTLSKINNLEKKYLIKIAETLEKNNIIKDELKVKNFLKNIFQNIPFNKLTDQKRYTKNNWLIEAERFSNEKEEEVCENNKFKWSEVFKGL